MEDEDIEQSLGMMSGKSQGRQMGGGKEMVDGDDG